MKLYTSYTGLAALRAGLFLPEAVNGYKGLVTHEKWDKWLQSPQPINNGYWLDYKNSPAWYFKAMGETLVELFHKINNTHPLLTSVRQVDEGIARNKPKDLATLNIEIIDGIRAVRRAEEGIDEADISESEANEFVTEGESARMLTGQSLASEILAGNYRIPMQHAPVPSHPSIDMDIPLDSEMGLAGPTQRTLNPVSKALDDSAIEKNLFEKIEGRRESVFREFEVLIDHIINTPVELKVDIWEGRTGPVFKTEIFVAVINLYKLVYGRVPLRDPEGLSYWLYNANSLNRDFEGRKMVKFNTQAKEDVKIAFELIVRAFDSMDQRLGKWLANLEKVLVDKEHIKLVRQPIIDLQLFAWSYRVSFSQLFKVINDGIKLPSSFVNG
ncbi:hypothetical protein TWF481_012213 [Arthrobotrys musiformis]|uniref:Uncharacterized protein n=1 Tax=Arthrobotrys musiformis TaxID=47236 RepID=A0AAV9VXT0_9PEZI